MEKPFGTDLASAKSLNAKLHEVFDEEQIFGSITFLARNRRKTFSRSASPTGSLSRSEP